ncbi:cell wall hydrolase [Phenylobacterium sp.]|uniref:cell wall hydrolase n=1 Tax=Phenylobacterium sp. TaxID=1871053 RepID=UPI00289A48B1|nr:cell wall hydrolase [Phenylobacterium sp.]
MIGSGIGLALGATYMAGGMARAATDYARNARIAEAAAGGFSESTLQREAAAMDPGVMRVASRHDPFTSSGAAQRDRQNAILAARLEQAPQEPARRVQLRGAIDAAALPAPAPMHLVGALESSRELECLTQAVYFEARGETPAGQAAVAQVVLNRVRHPAFPKSVCGVVFQGAGKRVGCQFSFACDGSMRRGRETAAWQRAQKVASRALSGGVMASIGDATHFHTTNVAPNWGPRLVRTAEVGMHVFYRFGGGRTTPKAEDRVLYASYAATPAPASIEVSGDMRAALLKGERQADAADAPKADRQAELVREADSAKTAPKLLPVNVMAPVKTQRALSEPEAMVGGS